MKKSIIPFLALAAVAASGAYAKESHDMALQRNLKTFNSMVKVLEENYVDSIRVDDAFNAASRAMLNTVDPYTEYYTVDDRDALMRMTTGEYAGIGSYITEYEGFVCISEPMEGSPAQKAGLLPGDRIIKVDTVDTSKKKSADVSKLLKGTPGTDVYVEVNRPYVQDSLLNFTITRAKVAEKSVPYYGMLTPEIGYVRLNSYIDKSPKEIETALDSLSANPGFKSLVFDLRGNGGGLVESAVEILGNFLPKGTEVLRTRGKGAERVYKTTHKPAYPDIPLVVLVDGGTASASEITAGALQDLDRAVLVGTRSFGKGLVQNTFPLPNDAMLKVTVSKYYIPSGRLIQALDYSRRNPDGSVARTPDSLTNVYTTARGREVRDGGGLTPDSVITLKTYSDLLYNLVSKNKMFDFANRYRAEHPEQEIAVEEFDIDSPVYDSFAAYVKESDMKYDTTFDALLKELRSQVKEQEYLTEENDSTLSALEKALGSDLDRDLELKRPEISNYLREEIATRYWGQRGRVAMEVKDDPAIDAAIAILQSPLYESILQTPNTKQKK